MHIYVDTTTLFVENTSTDALLKDFTIVYAQILDTIKGKILPDLSHAFIANDTSKLNIYNDNFLAPLPEKRFDLIFDYCNQWLLAGGNHYMTWDGKLQGTMEDKNGDPWIKPNCEYIVLLAPNYECTYDGRFYYALWPVGGSYSHGMYPIENGNVIDEGNVWGWGKSVNIDMFKNNLNILINEMENYGE